MDLELLSHAKTYIEKMANGINPLTNELIKEDDLINNIKISRCLFYVNNILGEVLTNKGINKTKKIPFNLDKDILNKYTFNEDLSISKIVSKINSLITNSNMSKLKVRDICNWLVDNKILEIVLIKDKNYKLPTEIGKSIGIYTEHRTDLYGRNYDIVIYNKDAQKFIIDNFDSLLEYISNVNK